MTERGPSRLRIEFAKIPHQLRPAFVYAGLIARRKHKPIAPLLAHAKAMGGFIWFPLQSPLSSPPAAKTVAALPPALREA